MSQITISATISALPQALEFLRSQAMTHGLSDNSIYQLEIAAEEALVNTMLHGYPHPDASNMITLEILADASECRLILTDQGIAFDPTEHVPEVDVDSADRDLGGLGIFFIYKYTDRVTYERIGSSNQLTLFKVRG